MTSISLQLMFIYFRVQQMCGIRSPVGIDLESIRAEGATVFSPAKRAKTNDQKNNMEAWKPSSGR